MIKMYKTSLLIFLFIPITLLASSEGATESYTQIIETLLIPAVLAVFTYLLKVIFDLYTTGSKRKRDLLEDKLKNFYWPILTRLEQNDAIWTLMLKKRNSEIELEKHISEYVEENIILTNHRAIMDIIIKNRYQAKFDEKISHQLQEYFRHVAIYEGILKSKEHTFPGLIGAPYPREFDKLIKERTEGLQQKLDKM